MGNAILVGGSPDDQEIIRQRAEELLRKLCANLEAVGIYEDPQQSQDLRTRGGHRRMREDDSRRPHRVLVSLANEILHEARSWSSMPLWKLVFEHLAEVAGAAAKKGLRQPSAILELRLFNARWALRENPDTNSYPFSTGKYYDEMPARARQAYYREDGGVQIDGGMLLAIGGFSEVKLVDYRGANRAVKIFFRTDRKSFERELEIMRELSASGHIVRVDGEDTSRLDSKLVLVIEHMTGGDLAAFIQECRTDPTKQMLLGEHRGRLLGDICEGLEFIHSKGFIHRDLKTANCLLGENLEVKISDFGISKPEGNVTTASLNCGSFNYIAPEVFRRELLRDRHSGSERDIYALGIICWEVMALDQAWRGLPDHRIMNAVVAGERPQTQPSMAPANVVRAMQKAWTQEPTDRPTATELKGMLAEDAVETSRRRIPSEAVDTPKQIFPVAVDAPRGWNYPTAVETPRAWTSPDSVKSPSVWMSPDVTKIHRMFTIGAMVAVVVQCGQGMVLVYAFMIFVASRSLAALLLVSFGEKPCTILYGWMTPDLTYELMAVLVLQGVSLKFILLVPLVYIPRLRTEY